MTTIDSAMYQVHVGVKFLDHGKGLDLPRYESEEAAGFDLAAAVPNDAPFELFPGRTALVPTGIALELPSGYEAQIRPRSGLAADIPTAERLSDDPTRRRLLPDSRRP